MNVANDYKAPMQMLTTEKKIRIAVPSVILVLLLHNTVTNVDQICHWSAISFSLVT